MQDVERVLSSGRLTDGQKHDALALVIERIVPDGEDENGKGKYRVELKGLDDVEKGHSISILCTVSTTSVEIVPRSRSKEIKQ